MTCAVCGLQKQILWRDHVASGMICEDCIFEREET